MPFQDDSIRDSEVEELWMKATMQQKSISNGYLSKTKVRRVLENGTIYSGTWFKNSCHGVGRLFSAQM
jgi:hypothetical protein